VTAKEICDELHARLKRECPEAYDSLDARNALVLASYRACKEQGLRTWQDGVGDKRIYNARTSLERTLFMRGSSGGVRKWVAAALNAGLDDMAKTRALFREPKTNCCTGHCCEDFTLTNEGGVQAIRDDPARWEEGAYILDMLVPLDDEGHFTCRHFDPVARLCTAYEARPAMCSTYGVEKGCAHGCGMGCAG
jgi:hypothetical protein